MAGPPWKTFIESRLRANIELVGVTATYLSLATVTTSNVPANRTVVFRGFSGQDHREETGWRSNLLAITTDRRSEKMKHIAQHPMAEANWYMSGTQEQFRIYGKMHAIGHCMTPPKDMDKRMVRVKDVDPATAKELATKAFLLKSQENPTLFDWEAERLRQWYRMNDGLRATFVPDCPFATLGIKDVESNSGWFVGHNDTQQHLLEEGYENFVVLLLDPVRIDYVALPTGEHTVYHKVDDNLDDTQWTMNRIN